MVFWATMLLMLTVVESRAEAAKVTLSCGSVGVEYEECRRGAESWAKSTGNQVEIYSAPNSSAERLAQLQLMLAAKSPSIDVFLIDTTWPGVLGEFLVDLGAYPSVQKIKPKFFKAFEENNTVKGRFIALPWFIDGGVLFYRKDLLRKYGESVPSTWTELTRIAEKVQAGERKAGSERFWGYVFQGRAYEGLTCNALEWISSWGGGSFVDLQGKITLNNPQALKAITIAAAWVGRISPPGVLNYMEEDARTVFQSGDAAFLRNWPYVWKVANAPGSPVEGKIGMALLPRGEGPAAKNSSVLGGWSLAVSKYSSHIEESVSLVTHLVSPEEQLLRAKRLGQNPSLPELFEKGILLEVFQTLVLRPARIMGSRYNRSSAEIWEQVHQVLAGKKTPEQGLLALENRLEHVSRGGRW